MTDDGESLGTRSGNKSVTGSFTLKPHEDGLDLDPFEMVDLDTKFLLVTVADQRRAFEECQLTEAVQSGDSTGEHSHACTFIGMRYRKN
jgi:hypothetical protein